MYSLGSLVFPARMAIRLHTHDFTLVFKYLVRNYAFDFYEQVNPILGLTPELSVDNGSIWGAMALSVRYKNALKGMQAQAVVVNRYLSGGIDRKELGLAQQL